ncbi:hypothetical protein [Heyndrickxia oleronia]|uniref:hypothetical protein n=1 Tax=Heyndrickxia oleronia TaxID=38875 RepID=UPI001B02206D|nr:hypothetical protein [Heyndrickxia oleronia]GIN39033.1 hypothetical protein J19TS1_19820 [Heyndrickxia oleronia]
MKKVFFVLLAALLFLVACNAEDSKEKTEKNNDTSEVSKVPESEQTGEEQEDIEDVNVDTEDKSESDSPINAEKVEEILTDYGLGEDDKIVSVSVEGGEIKAVIELDPSELVSIEDLAISRYSSSSDELLTHKGWEQLTIEFRNVGTISMNRSEKETNELDMDYFPTAVIMEKLNS